MFAYRALETRINQEREMANRQKSRKKIDSYDKSAVSIRNIEKNNRNDHVKVAENN